jgi:hypothetical protein
MRGYRKKFSNKPLCAPQNYLSEAFSSSARWAVYAGGQAVQEDILAPENGIDMPYRNVGNR